MFINRPITFQLSSAQSQSPISISIRFDSIRRQSPIKKVDDDVVSRSTGRTGEGGAEKQPPKRRSISKNSGPLPSLLGLFISSHLFIANMHGWFVMQ